DPRQPHAYFNLGNSLRQRGELDKALAAYLDALRLTPLETDASAPLARHFREEAGTRFHGLGGVRFLRKEYHDALAAYDKAIELYPGSAGTHRERANTLVRLGRIPDAIAAFEEAVRLDPTMEDAHFNLGGLLLGRGDAQRAAAAFAKAVELNGYSADN